MLERIFHVREAGSTPGREALGGLTTFLTMAYILAVNPVFLTAAGIPEQGAILATALSAAFATLLMAFARQLSHRPGAGHGDERLLRLRHLRGRGRALADGAGAWSSGPACCSCC